MKTIAEQREWFPKFIDHLAAYKNEFGNSHVPKSYICKDGYRLWQRMVVLSPAEIKQIDALGFALGAKKK